MSFTAEEKTPEVKALLGTAKVFGLNSKEIGKVIDVIVDVNNRDISGNEKASVVKEQCEADKGSHSWPDKAYRWGSLIVKVAWTIAKLTGRVK